MFTTQNEVAPIASILCLCEVQVRCLFILFLLIRLTSPASLLRAQMPLLLRHGHCTKERQGRLKRLDRPGD